MSSRSRRDEEPSLFEDLPLQADKATARPAAAAVPSTPTPAAPARKPEPLPLFGETADDDRARVDRDEPAVEGITVPIRRPPIPRRAQISASLLDLAALAVVGLALWLGLRAIGVQLDGMRLAFVLLFFVPFSFLYQVFPLAFWGRTPGMARVGLVARGQDGSSLTFSQAGLRWLASVLTVLFLGLPLLATQLTGRSLADRLSGSQTLPAR